MIDKKLYIDKHKSVLLGIYEDPDKFLEAVGNIYHKGATIIDCYTPFPIHGIEKAMGLKRSLLPVGAFIFGCCGFSLAFLMQWYMMRADWPMVIGNKPTVGISFMPVLFESSVLCTAFGLAFIFFWRSKLLHGKIPQERVDFRQTDDRMVVAISLDESKVSKSELTSMLFNGGAVLVKERTNHDYEDFTDVEVRNLGVGVS